MQNNDIGDWLNIDFFGYILRVSNSVPRAWNAEICIYDKFSGDICAGPGTAMRESLI